jgi:hypothetical protein
MHLIANGAHRGQGRVWVSLYATNTQWWDSNLKLVGERELDRLEGADAE